MNKHDDFILTPIIEVLEQGLHSISQLEKGIEHHALYDYIFQSIFLKMTGFQEQKCKCISWTLATHDYEYRYDNFNKKDMKYYSKYFEKNELFQAMIKNLSNTCFLGITIQYLINGKNPEINELEKQQKQIEKKLGDSSISTNEKKNLNNNLKTLKDQIKDLIKKEEEITLQYKKVFFKKTKEEIDALLEKYQIHTFSKINHITNIDYLDFLNEGGLLGKDAIKYYDLLYIHRNRCAHNTLSYQRNLPTLDVLASEHQPYNNYYVFFILLILIDKIFIEFYKQYLEEQHFEF